MRFWNQLAISVVVLAVGGAAWVRFAPGAGETLAAIGVSQPLIDALSGPQDGQAGSGGSGNAGRGQGGRGQGGLGGFADVPLVVVRPAASSLVNDRLNAIGNGEAIRSVTVTPTATGNLTEILVKSGDRIAEGQVIARLDSDDQMIAAEQARLTRDSAREKVERYRNLSTARAVTAVEVRDAEFALQAAELALKTAELDLKRRDIAAPSKGVVGIITVNIGDYVTTSTPIAVVDDRSQILVDFWVPERFAGKIFVDQPVTANAIARPARALQGVVHAIDNRLDPESRTLRVRARLENPDDMLRAGMSFSVTVAFEGDRYPTVDPLAIQWSSEGSFVWRVNGDKSERVPIKIIQRNPDKVLVEAELAEGDRVVTEGVQRLRDGGAVRIAGEPAAEAGQKVAGDAQ
ncbi:efflux RND transporter periplasmic adaptor subunit [Sinorhizobium medicae]|uniref:efflux RND transporter periplasmic adaptor subunit n=1 Tax=Sinorhizobium medicae TaxID=110321 RepID=UPI000C7E750E|nr:efflux RND transporter periplasmic adaptor subunit [Sinorhizobium medicae]MBO1943816.1 efflux RND transporter periplasmic adaptor subunit [Sinorhizobium medicae]MDX0485748.1 efflux RND transporter periplasmic adaptor subunit [Sinorhizobium medicae]MDX0493075.1 efflux RND transporter periplasmic adaptor subunit [Sinorhizobium medicae]MDX0498384.1 efflux RND transporter periplasmic adaptor subunit [Sinorhizobium medicae]MDX0510771.1 efflux RND transporter periplasmic adaptor subunit [Sinorhiz